ncbi:hypothetical protein CANCADRAFT_32999 [Tortispora caseinolytica NRRL Y-17796]|uniref:Dolichol kinase n=1 Tax=Tortispora caseinolytica NRRL Y-17796 TaxID=767744 RepID=A0A1E4T9G0_9ASCO|nr:hypothetical protein CANCADRAFT_32999 [Tortispora caseinolytica NRRL Y-17796]
MQTRSSRRRNKVNHEGGVDPVKVTENLQKVAEDQQNNNHKNHHITDDWTERGRQLFEDAKALLTPRSLSPLGLIPIHKKYRGFIHKYEVPRKLFHVSIGFITLALFNRDVNSATVLPVLIKFLAVVVCTDLMRFKWEWFSNLYIKVLGSLMRESEVEQLNGVVWYLVGLIVVFYFYPTDIAVLSVLLLSWADTTASIFGRAYGHLSIRIGRKSLVGSFAAFVTSTAAAYLWYGVILTRYSNKPGFSAIHGTLAWTPTTSKLPLGYLCVAAGFIGAVSEAIQVYSLDDNLTIPIISAVFMGLLFNFFKI